MAEGEASKVGRQPPLLYAFVARRTEVLAECAEYAGSLIAFVAKSMLRHPAADFTRCIDGHTFRYVVEDDITFCVVAYESTGQEIPNNFLEQVKHDFKRMCIGRKVSVADDSSFGSEFRSKLKEHIFHRIENSHEMGIPEIEGVVTEKFGNDLRKRDKDLQARELELNKREKELTRREEAVGRGDIECIIEKYADRWLKDFGRAKSTFESTVAEILKKNISYLKSELVSTICNKAEQVKPSSHKEKCVVKALSRDLTSGVMSTRKGTRNRFDVQDIAIIYDERMLAHKPPKGQFCAIPELPERLSKIRDRLIRDGIWQRCRIYECEEADTSTLEAVHDPFHVSNVQQISSQGKESVAEDVYYSSGTTTSALLAAGGVIKAVDLVVKGEVEASFAIIRPPGHHVGVHGPPNGFCFLNNVSIAATHLIKKHHMKRILLLDWDVHHGDGSQEIFYDDERVLVFSVHRGDDDMDFPCKLKRKLNNLGEGNGLGYNINICWRHAKIRDVDYHVIWDHILLPICQEFKPEMILISAGFDAAKGDDYGSCDVTPNGFATLLGKLKPLAPISMALEGGYNKTVTSQAAAACLKVLLGDKSETVRDRAVPYKTTISVVLEAQQILKPYWKCMESVLPEAVRNNTIPAPKGPESLQRSAATSLPG